MGEKLLNWWQPQLSAVTIFENSTRIPSLANLYSAYSTQRATPFSSYVGILHPCLFSPSHSSRERQDEPVDTKESHNVIFKKHMV